MTLGKCLDCMKWNQSHKKGSKRLIPFRDSKLTRLFKNYFEGKGSVRMIVNISQVLSSFDETAHVLRFSAMARQVSTTAVTSKINTGLNKIKGELAMSLTSDIMDLEDYNSSLHEKLAELQQQLIDVEMRSSKMEEAIREEVAEEMAEQMLALEQGYQNAATQQTAATEQKFEKKWGVYTHSVARLPAKSRINSGGVDKDVHADLQQQHEALTREHRGLAKELGAVKESLNTCTDVAKEKTSQYESLVAETKLLEAGALDMQEALSLAKAEIAGLEATAQQLQDAAVAAQNTNAGSFEALAQELSELKRRSAADKDQHNSALAEQAQSLAERHASEVIDLKGRHASELEGLSEVSSATCKKLEQDLASATGELDEKKDEMRIMLEQIGQLGEQLSAAEAQNTSATNNVAHLEKENSELKKKQELADKKSKLAVNALERKIRGHQDTIATLQVTSADYEAKNNKLQAKVAGLLSEHMDDDVMKYVTTPAGAILSRMGSVVSATGNLLSVAPDPSAPSKVVIKVSPRKSTGKSPAPTRPARQNTRRSTSGKTFDSNASQQPENARPTRSTRSKKAAAPTAPPREPNPADLKKSGLRLSTIDLNTLAIPEVGEASTDEPAVVDVTAIQRQTRARNTRRSSTSANTTTQNTPSGSKNAPAIKSAAAPEPSTFSARDSGKRKTASNEDKENAQTPASSRKKRRLFKKGVLSPAAEDDESLEKPTPGRITRLLTPMKKRLRTRRTKT